MCVLGNSEELWNDKSPLSINKYLLNFVNNFLGGIKEQYVQCSIILHFGTAFVFFSGTKTPTSYERTAPAKLDELNLESLSHPSLSIVPDISHLFENQKIIFERKIIRSNDKSIVEAEAYFEGPDKFSYKECIAI